MMVWKSIKPIEWPIEFSRMALFTRFWGPKTGPLDHTKNRLAGQAYTNLFPYFYQPNRELLCTIFHPN
jgi:hypothetical protein